MKKNRYSLVLTALAFAAGAQPVFAQSSVTLYGIVDTFIANTRGGGDGTALDGRGGLAGSRLGFQGSEDLGSGLSAVYRLEYQLVTDTATGLATAREQWVGLKSAWGTLTGGLHYAPGLFLAKRFDPMDESGRFSPRGQLAIASGYTIQTGPAAKWSNSLKYASPKIGGWNLYGIFANHDDETSDHSGADDRWGLGAYYENGPFKAALVYHAVGVGAGIRDTREYFVGAGYDFGVVRLMGTWQQRNADGHTDADSKLYSIGAKVRLSQATSIEGGFGRLDPRGGDNDANSATLGVIHNLSKRTSLYAAYNRLHFDDSATKRSGIVRTVDAGETANTIVAGIRHKFWLPAPGLNALPLARAGRDRVPSCAGSRAICRAGQ